MDYKIKQLPASQIEINVTVSAADYAPQLEPAAKRLSEKIKVKGFRPGKMPYKIVKQQVGEMAIMQEASMHIIQKAYIDVIKKEELDVIGQPEVNIEKIAPENDFVFVVKVAQLPELKLAALSKVKVKRDKADVNKAELEETLDALRGMHAKEVEKDGKAGEKDKLVIDMNMLIDKVPVDGGQSKDYQVYLSEKHYIPGFNEKLIGAKKGDEKKFSLDFPEDHYQKHLAGKTVDFEVTVKDVFERQLPELTDEFVKPFGQESVADFKALIESNLLQRAKQKVEEKVEIAILEGLIEKSSFGDLPEVLLNSERQKIFYELKRDIEKAGATVEQYLADMKKTEAELFEGFTDQATRRVKAALISRAVAKEQNISATEEEIDAEIAMVKAQYPEDKQEMLDRPEVRDTIASTIQNKKVVAWLKKETVGPAPVDEPKKKASKKASAKKKAAPKKKATTKKAAKK